MNDLQWQKITDTGDSRFSREHEIPNDFKTQCAVLNSLERHGVGLHSLRIVFWGLCLLWALLAFPMAAKGAGMTVITHGYQLLERTSHIDEEWVEAMGDYVADIANRNGGNALVLKMIVKFSPENGYSVTIEKDAGDDIAISTNAEVIVKLYWDTLAFDPVIFPTNYIAAVVAPMLMAANVGAGSLQIANPMAEMPVHLIGHSRGASLVTELSKALGENGIWVDQVTTLDPRPVTFVGNDPVAQIYETTTYADNYYQRKLLSVLKGRALVGAYNRELNDYLDGGNGVVAGGDHSDVHLWYHGTVNTDQEAWDGEGEATRFNADMRANWYAGPSDKNNVNDEARGAKAGFYFSRLNGRLWEGFSSGYYNARDFTGINQTPSNRIPLSRSQGNQWPNVIKLWRPIASKALNAGESFSIKYTYQCYNQTASTHFYISADENPYNGNEIPIATNAPSSHSATQRSTPTVQVQATIPSNAPAGTYFLYSKMSAADGKTRYTFDPEKVAVSSTGILTPLPPTNLVAQALSGPQISVKWEKSVNATGYSLLRKTGFDGTYAELRSYGADASADFDTTVVPDRTYFYRVVALGAIPSAPSNEACASTLGSPTAPRTLTVNAQNLLTQVRVYVGVNDNVGLADGNTPFARQYTNAFSVDLVAPAAWDGRAFAKWQKDGVDWSFSPVTSVSTDVSHTMTAVYSLPVPTGLNVAVNSFPADAGAVNGGGLYASGASVGISAVPASGFRFVNWTINAPWSSGGQVFTALSAYAFSATSNLTLIANFAPENSGNMITLSPSPSVAGTASGGGSYSNGQTATIAAIPANGYSFGTWTDEFGTLVSFNSSFAFPVYQSRNFTANFNVAASGIPDLVPKIKSYQAVSFPGATLNVKHAVKNYGLGSSNPFATYFIITSSGNLAPTLQDVWNSGQIPWTLGFYSGITSGVEAGGDLGWTLPANLVPGEYFLWFLTDPEAASGEPSGTRGNNNVAVPLSIKPNPPIQGPDLETYGFNASGTTTMPGASMSVNGGVRNVGNAASTAFKIYVSISLSSVTPPDKNALFAWGQVSSLGVYGDAGFSSSFTLPGNLSPGNYYIWIMVDPENSGGEALGNLGNNNIVLPIAVVAPQAEYTIAVTSSNPVWGSVTGGGTYAGGAVVPLVATASNGYVFQGWSEGGVAVGTSSVYTFAASASRSLVANFVAGFSLVATASNGTIQKSPDLPLYLPGATVSVTANAMTGYRFLGWGGDVSGTANPTQVTMNASKSVEAIFAQLTPLEAWRVANFGTFLGEGHAADIADPDGDGYDNLFEFVSGLEPNNASSRFHVRVEAVVGQPQQKAIVFGPILGGRTYLVRRKGSLLESVWESLPDFATNDVDGERTVLDLSSGVGTKFYRVEIAKP